MAIQVSEQQTPFNQNNILKYVFSGTNASPFPSRGILWPWGVLGNF